MMTTRNLLQKLDSTLRAYNPINHAKLKQPLPEKEIENYMSKLQVNNEDFKLLFTWKDGYDVFKIGNAPCQIFDFGTLLSLQSIVDVLEQTTEDDRWEGEQFVPLIAETTGEYILLDNGKGATYGQLFLYSVPYLHIEPEPLYDSISSMVETTIEGYEKKILKYNAEFGYLDRDVLAFRKVGMKHNKKAKFWTT
jgi:hypothetical protein